MSLTWLFFCQKITKMAKRNQSLIEQSSLQLLSCLIKPIDPKYDAYFRQEVESRTQGSRPRTQKKNPRPRPRTAFPRTEPLEAKDRTARGLGQGPRTQVQAFSKKKKVFKKFFQAISNSLAYPEFLIGKGLNHKSHKMTSSKFFQRGSFCGTKIS